MSDQIRNTQISDREGGVLSLLPGGITHEKELYVSLRLNEVLTARIAGRSFTGKGSETLKVPATYLLLMP